MCLTIKVRTFLYDNKNINEDVKIAFLINIRKILIGLLETLNLYRQDKSIKLHQTNKVYKIFKQQQIINFKYDNT